MVAVSARFDIIDGAGKASFTKVRIPTGFSIAQMIEFAQGMAALISPLLGGQIVKAGICVGLDLSGASLIGSPSFTSDVHHKGAFGFATEEAGLYTRLNLPTLNSGVVATGSDNINEGNADVAAFLAAMENGIVVTGGTISPCDNRENDIVGTRYSKEVFRRGNLSG